MHITHRVATPKPVQEYTKRIEEYSHLTEQETEEIQKMVDTKYAKLVNLLTKE